jgi:cysteinyl-tRNA synthetase
VMDLDRGRATVVGRGVVTVRKHGRITTIPSGEELAIADLASMAEGTAAGPSTAAAAASGSDAGGSVVAAGSAVSPLLEAVARIEASFDDALAARDVRAAARAILELEEELVGWSRDTLQSDEQDRARSVLRGMIVRLGELAEGGARDPAEVLRPFVETILAARTTARDQKRWADADALRDRLVGLGVEVQDSPQGTSWRLLS